MLTCITFCCHAGTNSIVDKGIYLNLLELVATSLNEGSTSFAEALIYHVRKEAHARYVGMCSRTSGPHA
jgi:hypothetical protein